MPSLIANARQQATWLWQSMQNHQMALWYDNWVKKNYGVDPLHPDHPINCTVVAVLQSGHWKVDAAINCPAWGGVSFSGLVCCASMRLSIGGHAMMTGWAMHGSACATMPVGGLKRG